jgi:hypothetical protein
MVCSRPHNYFPSRCRSPQSSFKVPTACPTAEKQIRTVNLNRKSRHCESPGGLLRSPYPITTAHSTTRDTIFHNSVLTRLDCSANPGKESRQPNKPAPTETCESDSRRRQTKFAVWTLSEPTSACFYSEWTRGLGQQRVCILQAAEAACSTLFACPRACLRSLVLRRQRRLEPPQQIVRIRVFPMRRLATESALRGKPYAVRDCA